LGLKSRVEGLSEKLKDTMSGCFVHLDFDSFSEPEKRLFAKVDEIEEKYIQTGSLMVLLKMLHWFLRSWK